MNTHLPTGKIYYLLNIPIWIFLISFSGGTFLFLLYLAGNNDSIFMAGVFYLAAAFIINAIAFVAMVISIFFYYDYWQIILLRAALLLVNIPIALLYLFILLGNQF